MFLHSLKVIPKAKVINVVKASKDPLLVTLAKKAILSVRIIQDGGSVLTYLVVIALKQEPNKRNSLDMPMAIVLATNPVLFHHLTLMPNAHQIE